MSSMKIEYEQQGVFFECAKCPDRLFDPVTAGGHVCRKTDRKIDCDPFSDVPEWCPRFPI